MGKLLKIIKNNLSLCIIIAAALILELVVVVMFYTSHNIIHETVEQLVEREMNSIFLGIRNKLAKVEVTIDNMSWVIEGDLGEPDKMFMNTHRLLENNPAILGSSITFIPNYYPQKGRWFEPYSIRRPGGTIEDMQLGSATHDYTKSEFFTVPIATGKGHWCEPYMDREGANTMITTYAVPVHDSNNKIVAVVNADLSLGWLKEMLEENKVYESTQRFLLTGKNHVLAGQDGPMLQTVLKLVSDDDDKQGYIILEDEEGETSHVFFHPIGGMTNWVLVNVLNDNEVFGKLRMVRFWLLLGITTGMLILGFIIYRTSRNLERLRKINAEKERISSELHVAAEIQQSMLRNNKYLLLDNVELFGSLVPAREVGGDLFNYIFRDDKLFFCIADVCGKGTPAAMLMAGIQSLLYAFTLHEDNPARVIQDINAVSSDGNDSCMFFTLFLGVLDLPTGRLHYCNAGHNAPFILGKEPVMLDCDPNLPIGPFEDAEFSLQEMTLSPGSSLFLYTDGLTEAENAEGEQFGVERTEEVLRECIDQQLNAKEIVNKVTERVHQFVKDAEQSDDLTLFVIRLPQKAQENS